MRPSEAKPYLKTAATVRHRDRHRDRGWLTVQTDAGKERHVQRAYRSGKGHHDAGHPGRRLLRSRSPNEDGYRERGVGGCARVGLVSPLPGPHPRGVVADQRAHGGQTRLAPHALAPVGSPTCLPADASPPRSSMGGPERPPAPTAWQGDAAVQACAWRWACWAGCASGERPPMAGLVPACPGSRRGARRGQPGRKRGRT